MDRRFKPLADRLEKRTDKSGGPDACWEWTGAKSYNGYGRICVGKVTKRATRVVYEREHGPLPDGLHVLHRCDNPGCVNPRHLFAGSHQENMADRDRKGRQATGNRHGMTKLSADQILNAFRSDMPRKEIAARYGVTRALIGQIKRGVIHADITGA